MWHFKIIIGFILLFLLISCLKRPDLYKYGADLEESAAPLYLYPYDKEIKSVTAEIVIHTKQNIAADNIRMSIPPLKYNKSLLFLLTQDDCRHATYCCTWAAIHGRPLSRGYYYNVRQYIAGDLPPDVYSLKGSLGCTDGAGNEVRFAITATLAPEWEYMNSEETVRPDFKGNFFRFYMKPGLIWDNVMEMLNFGTGIAFHDVNTQYTNDRDSVLQHYRLAQDSILNHLSGRGCKMLAEPNGNKTYIEAADSYAPIHIITAQEQTIRLYPFQVKDDLEGAVIHRSFWNVNQVKEFVISQLNVKRENREAVSIGVHNTGADWTDFLLWLDSNYGQNGTDVVWFPSLEEYYEYNYYRIHGNVEKEIGEKSIKLKVTLPMQEYFYYPALTINLDGIQADQVESVTADESVTGLSYRAYDGSLMINMDCRKYLLEHAAHYVELYEKSGKKIAYNDALYFVKLLKDSSQKSALLTRLKKTSTN